MDEMYRKVVDAAAIFSETDLNGRITYVNEPFCTISGYSREELLGQNHRLLNSGFHPAEFFTDMWRTLALGQVWKGEVCNRAKDGSLFWLESTMVPLLDEVTGRVRKYLSIRFDVSEKQRLLHTLQWRVGHDVLTGLPNRAFLSELLNQSLEYARREQIPLAVCMLDLDGFKAINDSYGHASGDALLVEVAARLRGVMRGEDVVARLAGDEFVLILRYVRNSQELRAALQRVLWALAAPYSLHQQEVHVHASIGVTLFPEDDEDAETLLRHADQAMYMAKQGGRNRFQLFDVSLDQEIRATYQTVELLRQALAADELRLVYQPKVNLRSGQVVGFEAQVCWQSPQRGLLESHEFLPLVAQTEVIGEIGEWAIERVLVQIRDWLRAGFEWPVSLDVAARHFQRADFVPRLRSLLARYVEVPAWMLDLEIVESVAIENIQRVSQCLHACQALGVRFSLDDFGTGYSSLSYLKRLPTETIKIDPSFVRDILHDQDDLALTTAIIGLARAFGREVVAEGLETAEQGQLLVSLGCDVAQGQFIARPMGATQVPGWVRAFAPSPLWRALPAP
ncbi:putative bifunctional diguanylate cyclase/phosphodiesterase [Pseudomonas vanderleydeniana]|uniref:EAL domain-containing protein n=1 Tax=Pseudomonas vanderleydeniana TaxID=2745495 RepID=A0A9E6TTY4_9PSED|nr:GGDEF and EAL domain-containing protein [Pseudomonas vanderleydeniana]QXI30267.1 EAL domain-containing protein [Pseudomonas vanderleydeniana]